MKYILFEFGQFDSFFKGVLPAHWAKWVFPEPRVYAVLMKDMFAI